MGFWAWLGRALGPEPYAPTATFSESAPKPIDQMFLEMRGGGVAPRVGRDEALSVPTVQRGRNLVCSIATLPLQQLDPKNKVVRNPLLEQFDPDIANVVHLAQTLEDLVFESIAWWRITGFGFDGFPMTVRRLDPGTVSLEPPAGRSLAPLPSGSDPRGAVVWVDGKPVPASEMIRFDSPNPAVLKVGGRAIKRAILLDQAARMYAEDPRPQDYFTATDDRDPASDPDIEEFLGSWRDARKTRSTAYVPVAVEYHTVNAPTPAELQLVELQRQAGLDIANAFGVDPEDLGISTTSRTYQNDVDRRRARINEVLAPYMRALTDRLSMGDVTKRGYRVVFDLDDYLKSNPTERWNTYKTAKDMGVMDVEEIRAKEGLPEKAMPEPEPASTIVDAPESNDSPESVAPANVGATATVGATFDDSERLTFADVPVTEFSVDSQARTIEGLALPYGKIGVKHGLRFRFDRGALQFGDVGRVKLLRDHDSGQPLGVATDLKDTPAGFKVKFRVARGAAGDEALALAEDGVLDGLSVGVDFDFAADTAPDPRNKGVSLVRRADLREVSLTAMPAFDDARVTKVAASRDGGDMTETATSGEPPTVADPAPQGMTFTAEQIVALLGRNPLADPPAEQQGTPEQEPRQVVDPTRLTASVTEPAPYRFSRDGALVPAKHDFGIDLVRAVHPDYRDQAAHDRVTEFMRHQFTVVSTDVNELNPTINMPRYIDEREFTYPIYNAVNRGAPPNGIQPFQWPKFNSASGLVGAHTEGTEPTSGNYTTTVQSVTPVPLSGKASISRETWDMGGVPGVGDIIWRRITRDWYESLEAAIVTMLDAATPTSLGTFTAGGGTGHLTLVQEMRRALALLQFARGGFRFDVAFAEAGLYTHLADAVDSAGRPIFPQVNPQNADGDAAGRWATLNVGGIPFLPAWALGATVPAAAADSSYLVDRTAVDCWSTPPQRLTFDMTEVAFVHIGVWGYHAEAINDLAGVREIIYDATA